MVCKPILVFSFGPKLNNWNYPNKKWNYFSHFQASDQKTSFTKKNSHLFEGVQNKFSKQEMELSKHILTYLDLCWPIRTYLDLSQHILSSIDLIWTIWTYLDLSWSILTWPILTNQDLSWPILKYLDLSQPILIYLDIFWPTAELRSLCIIMLVSKGDPPLKTFSLSQNCIWYG